MKTNDITKIVTFKVEDFKRFSHVDAVYPQNIA